MNINSINACEKWHNLKMFGVSVKIMQLFYINTLALHTVSITASMTYEPCHEETRCLPMQKQRHK